MACQGAPRPSPHAAPYALHAPRPPHPKGSYPTPPNANILRLPTPTPLTQSPAPHTPHLTTCTLHPTPYTLHPIPYTLHHTLYTIHPTPYILHPTFYALHPKPYTLHPAIYTLHPAPYTLHPAPYTLHDARRQGGLCVRVQPYTLEPEASDPRHDTSSGSA